MNHLEQHTDGSREIQGGVGTRRHPSLVRPGGARVRAVIGICGLLLAGGLAAGCGGSGAAAPSSTPTTTATNQANATAATVAPTTTTTTLPAQCGSARDPLDPTDTPAPSPPAC